MLLRKTLSLSNCDIKLEGESGKFAGYASVFGGVDSYKDTILKGAFEYTLRNHGKPKMFFQHDWHMPIGKWLTAKEDDHGLYVEGELTPGHSMAADVHAALRHGTLDGLSIGGYLKKGDYDETENGRIIRRWSELSEVSPVVFPADGAARIDLATVKAEDIAAELNEIGSMAQFEAFLRDTAGIHGPAAAAFIAKCRALFTAQDAGDLESKQFEEIAMALIARRLRRTNGAVNA